MAEASGAITFVVPGQDESHVSATRGAAGAAPSPLLGGKVVHSVRVFSQRAGGGDVEVTAIPEQDVVALHITNGPTLYLHAESARDLFLGQAADAAGRGAAAADSGKIRIPAQLAWKRLEQAGATRGATRGLLGDALLKLVEVIRGPAADFVAGEIVEHVDDQVDEGVYQLAPNRLDALKGGQRVETIPASGDEPILVFIHGTFSTTSGTFEKLWAQHPQRVQQLFDHYHGRVYALDHCTLGASPIENALTLARALPKNSPIHLVTHSRGGLVAEVLARACSSEPLKPEDLEEIFAGGDYEKQRKDLAALIDKAQGLRVSRVVRVACPARGTLLASKRLDAYLSVFKWTLELARIPVAPQIVKFLAAVAQRRTDPQKIPGLAAQIPSSPLVQWLHSPTERIAGELRVVAGDIAGDSVASWLKVLLSDSFFRTDNDLVVQTSSMYGGTPRENGASFLFDQGGKVSHFSYFSNELTARAVVEALTTNDVPAGFRTIGPLSWAGESATGERAPSTGPDPSKPAVFLLPGILGSNLKQGEDRIWLAFRIVFGLTRLAYKSDGKDGIEPDGPVGRIYDDLVRYLSATHEVIEFPFDWRRPIEEEGRRLADEVARKLDARKESGKPVRIIAHSMGGLVARAMQLERPKVWERMLATNGARVLMLGTPNGGSWAPMQVLSGDDSFGNLLVGFGAPFKQTAARSLMAAMPGFIQMQAKITDKTLGLDRREKWQQLAEADAKLVREQPWWRHVDDMIVDEFRWGIPTQDVLDRAVALRARFDEQKDSAALVPAASKVLLVVGKADFTPDGYEFKEEDGLVYLDAQQAGDGRVTLENARLPNVPAWTLDCEHGELPHDKRAFAAYADLLETGSTNKLPALAAPSRGTAQVAAPVVHVRSRRARIALAPRPPETPADALEAVDRETRKSVPAAGPVLEVSVLNANLAFVQLPLMIGHYRAERLTGTEKVMDGLIGGKMQSALTLADYPSEPGTSRVFPNTRQNPDDTQRMPRPSAVIVVGLGEEGDFRGPSLVEATRKGAISAAQWAARDPKNLPQFELAATLIGSGGPSISAGQAAQLVAQGVREANVALAQLGGECPLIGHLQFVELYLDRAAEALRALQTQVAASPALFRLRDEKVQSGAGALRRPLDAGYRGTTYDFISALADKPDGASPEQVPIRYALDTRRARTEVRTQKPQSRLVRELVKTSARSALEDKELGKTLFRLLVPADLEPYLGGTMELVIELNRQTAGIPWELVEAPDSGDSRPWALRSKLLRKLRTEDPPPRVPDAGKDAGILIIGEPWCDDPSYPRLPGARLEANAVLKRLTAARKFPPERVRALIAPDDGGRGPSFDEVTKALMSGKWRVLHVSGHGATPEGDHPSRGVVLSSGVFIGAEEIDKLRPVPELVFVNCCHLGASSPDLSRPEFAASVAQALIGIGVRCVVAAGWAVDDDVAAAFADTLYKRLLEGDRFMDAVFLAREAAHAKGGNTWAAYQCYGDPNWTLDIAGGDPQKPAPPPGPEFAGVTSALALVLALETIAIECQSRMPRFTLEELKGQRLKIRYLESLPAAAGWGKRGDVAEAFAKAWKDADDARAGLDWYGKALAAQDGGASMKAIEQYENLRVRVAAEKVDTARKAGDPSALRATAKVAAEEVRDAIRELEKLFEELPSMERANLCASANKRLAMILEACGDPDAEAVDGAKRYYAAAERLGEKSPDVFYPTMNIMALDVMARPKSVPPDRFLSVRQKLRARSEEAREFWSAVGDIELSLYEALNDNALAPKLPALNHDFDDLRERWPAPWMWRSVRDQARFIFPRYAQRASPDETAAAGALRAKLEAYAAETEPARQAPPPKAPPPAKAVSRPNAPPKPPAAAARPKKASGARNARRGRARRS